MFRSVMLSTINSNKNVHNLVYLQRKVVQLVTLLTHAADYVSYVQEIVIQQ